MQVADARGEGHVLDRHDAAGSRILRHALEEVRHTRRALPPRGEVPRAPVVHAPRLAPARRLAVLEHAPLK